jgi:hypothetical protein
VLSFPQARSKRSPRSASAIKIARRTSLSFAWPGLLALMSHLVGIGRYGQSLDMPAALNAPDDFEREVLEFLRGFPFFLRRPAVLLHFIFEPGVTAIEALADHRRGRP